MAACCQVPCLSLGQPALRLKGEDKFMLTKETIFHPILKLSQSGSFLPGTKCCIANYDSHLL